MTLQKSMPMHGHKLIPGGQKSRERNGIAQTTLSAGILRRVFCGNKYRLWTQISYKNKIVLIKKMGTHNEYEKWDLG